MNQRALTGNSADDIVLQGPLCIEREHFSVQRVVSQEQQRQADELVTRLYRQRGYDVAQDAMATREVVATSATPGQAPQLTTLIACKQQQLFGTLSVAIDSPRGLQADQLYRPQLDAYRREGRLVAEFCRLAMDPEHSTKEMLGAVFHLACIHLAPLNGATDAVIEVNPRHAGFYQRSLGFKRIGPERLCPRVNAPAVLLHVEFAHVARQVRLLGGSAGQASQRSRSLYAYFFSQQTEDQLLQKTLGQRLRASSVAERLARSKEPRALRRDETFSLQASSAIEDYALQPG